MGTSTNVKGAVFSFLRVLAVALASAILPFITAPQSDEVPTRAIVTAIAAAFLLTVINFFRTGETRFGPEPKVNGDEIDAGRDHNHDHGAGEVRLILCIAAAIFVAYVIFLVLTSVL